MGFFDFLASASPAGAAATVGERMVGTVVDGVDKIIRDFKLPPEASIKWEEFKLQVVADAAKVSAADRDSARQREIAVKDKTPATLAFVIVGGFLAATLSIIASALMGYEIPAAAAGLVGTLIGYLSAKSELALAYYFGSSSGSQAKTELLARADAIK